MMSGWSTGIDNMYYQLDYNYKRYLDLSFDQIATIMLNIEEEFRLIKESLLDRESQDE